MATSKKVTDLTAATNAAATDLMYIVSDPSGIPTSKKITVSAVLGSNLPASFANVTAANILSGSGVVQANVITINYRTAPSSNTDVPAGASNSSMWSDGNYIYVVANTAATTQKVKRVALSNF